MTPDSIREVIVEILSVINPDNVDQLAVIDDEQFEAGLVSKFF